MPLVTPTGKRLYGYTRVSTVKQGEHGVSLNEQRESIARYAERNGLTITDWFEERQTAAKQGRPVFSKILKLLRNRRADGLIVHKIDRSARNLKDWSMLGELIDAGIDVRFANDSLDLHSRGGRLSADIQAVVAADFIRNLREETRKGFYGRLKQGLYPLPAPLGYLDCGKGQPKAIDPVNGPLVRRLFELYGRAQHGMEQLVCEADRLGLRSRFGGRVSLNGVSTILHNPFYMGLIRLKRTGETFAGTHEALIPKTLFDRVQQTFDGKFNRRVTRHEFLFRRLLSCQRCGYSLIGERQKGHVYYRCHTKACVTIGIREEVVEEAFRQLFQSLQFSAAELDYFRAQVNRLRQDWGAASQAQAQTITLQHGQLQARLTRLTDAYLDGALDRSMFEERKASLLMDRRGLEECLARIKEETCSPVDRIAEFLELANTAQRVYELGKCEDKRELVQIVTSNRKVDGKSILLEPSFPFRIIANRPFITEGDPYRGRPRTVDRLLKTLRDWFLKHGETFSLPVR